MMANITGNLDTLGQESLAGFEVVEEEVGEGGEGAVEIVEEVVEEGPGGEAAELEEAAGGESENPAEMLEGAVGGAGDGGDAEIAEMDAAAAGNEGAEFVEVTIDGSALDGIEEIMEEAGAREAQAMTDAAELTALETESLDYVEETDGGAEGPGVAPDGENIDDDLREKTDLLTRLAEAAGTLQAMGPDLNGGLYTEEEVRGKAKFLSEEFDRYLSIRNRFYNVHILIKGGDYLVGGAHLAKSELAEQIVTLQDFYISKFPVTNALFEIFVEQTGYITTAEKYGFSLVYFPRMQRSRDPVTGVERFSLHNQAYCQKVAGACWHQPFGPGSSLHLKRSHPVVQVTVEDARAFAVWTGKRLPTEIEWEAAARTVRGNIYPWGNEWQDDACNIEKSLHGDTSPVDQYVKFANSAEVADTLGNVLEWTGDVIGDRETADTYIAKGASWISNEEISLTDRHYIEMNASSNILGFRCVAI